MSHLEPQTGTGGAAKPTRLVVLDGWRAISILLVLGAHMLPLGPKRFELNATSGYLGMSLFFTLSGFLITCQLHERPNVRAFFVRRFFRILPLAYLAIVADVLLNSSSLSHLLLNFAFAQTYVESAILPDLGHFWSLCVEIHFYLFIGFLTLTTRLRGFLVVPLIWAVIVAARVYSDRTGGRIHTHMRVDEILSGCMLALLFLGRFGSRARSLLAKVPFAAAVAFLLLACHPYLIPLHGFRGLAASSVVGITLLSESPNRYRLLGARPLRYLAEVSFALYVLHPFSMHGWLGVAPNPTQKYLKRILCFGITFGLAHISTYYYEMRFIQWGKRLCKRLEPSTSARVA
jgi:peptidoglycan/LPS O-acetylase OafA/YrhL